MKTPRILATAIASLLSASPLFAVTDTWDGGGADSNISTNNNWFDNTAPVSDLLNTDLIFTASQFWLQSSPNFSVPFSADSLTFNSSADPDVFNFSGSALTIGTTGIANSDDSTHTFNNPVALGAATSTFATGSGLLVFNGSVNLGTSALSVTGAGNTSFRNFAGTGSVTKSGAGTMMWAPTATTSADFIVNAGTLSTVTDGSTDILDGSASLAVNGTSTLFINENMVLDGGVQLTRQAGAAVKFTPGKTLTIQGGSDFVVTGDYSPEFEAGSLVVTGAGSTMQTLSGGILLASGGTTLAVQNGGSVSASGSLYVAATGGLGTVLVDGAASSLSVGGVSDLSSGPGSGFVTFSNNATGSLAAVEIAVGNGNIFFPSNAVVQVLSGADVTNSGSLLMSDLGVSGSLTVSGAGSTWTQTGANSTTLGAAGFGSPTAFLNVQNGGVFTSGTGSVTLNSSAMINIAGGTVDLRGPVVANGGRINYTSGTLSIINDFSTVWFNGGLTIGALNGGSVSVGGSLEMVGTLLVDGAASSLSVGGTLGFYVGNISVTFSSNAMGSLAAISIPGGNFFNPGDDAVMQVLSGADVTNGGSFQIGHFGGQARLTVSGVGSTWTQTAANSITLGAATGSPASLNVLNGGVFTSGTGSVTLNPTATINIIGGSLDLRGPFVLNGGTLNFASGMLSIVDNLIVGTGGLFGTSPTLAAAHSFATSATTIIDASRTLTLNGGTFSTGALVNHGTLAITGPGGLNIGTLPVTGGFNVGNGALGSSVTLEAGGIIAVTNTTTVAAGALLRIDGGGFSGGSIVNSGTIDHQDGALGFTGTLNNTAAGRLFVGGLSSSLGTIDNAGRITLQNGLGFLGGAGAITNAGLITGDGTIAKALTNNLTGEIRAEAGKIIALTGANAANAGKFNLLGGELDFTQAQTNGASGQINGHGTLNFAAGLTNAGQMNFSGGLTDVFGTVNLLAGSKLITSGGGISTFYGAVTHNATEVRTSAGAQTVFFGLVNGAGPFTGTGAVFFEGGYSPGNSPAPVLLGTDVIFGDANTLTLELGGLTAGSEYDQLIVGAGGSLALDGELVLDLIDGFVPAFGDTFQVLDFDPGQVSGAFDEVTFADALPGDLAFDTSSLPTTGTITVVPEPGSALLALLGTAFLGFRRHRR